MARKIIRKSATCQGGFIDDTHPTEDPELLRITENAYNKFMTPQQRIETSSAYNPVLSAYWENLTRVALTPFRPLQKLPDGGKERVSDREYSQRLKKIEQSCYKIPPYSQMPREGKARLLYRIQTDIRNKAKRYCPRTLAEIDKENERQRLEARL